MNPSNRPKTKANIFISPQPTTTNTLREATGTYQVDHDLVLTLALKIDTAVKKVRPDGWRGEKSRENVIKRELFQILGDIKTVERIFLIIKEQSEY